jgi:hypothetical protein
MRDFRLCCCLCGEGFLNGSVHAGLSGFTLTTRWAAMVSNLLIRPGTAGAGTECQIGTRPNCGLAVA